MVEIHSKMLIPYSDQNMLKVDITGLVYQLFICNTIIITLLSACVFSWFSMNLYLFRSSIQLIASSLSEASEVLCMMKWTIDNIAFYGRFVKLHILVIEMFVQGLQTQVKHDMYQACAELIFQTFRNFTYVTVHFPTHPSLYIRHSSFPNSSFAYPTSQFIFQPYFRFSYITSSSLNE